MGIKNPFSNTSSYGGLSYDEIDWGYGATPEKAAYYKKRVEEEEKKKYHAAQEKAVTEFLDKEESARLTKQAEVDKNSSFTSSVKRGASQFVDTLKTDQGRKDLAVGVATLGLVPAGKSIGNKISDLLTGSDEANRLLKESQDDQKAATNYAKKAKELEVTDPEKAARYAKLSVSLSQEAAVGNDSVQQLVAKTYGNSDAEYWGKAGLIGAEAGMAVGNAALDVATLGSAAAAKIGTVGADSAFKAGARGFANELTRNTGKGLASNLVTAQVAHEGLFNVGQAAVNSVMDTGIQGAYNNMTPEEMAAQGVTTFGTQMVTQGAQALAIKGLKTGGDAVGGMVNSRTDASLTPGRIGLVEELASTPTIRKMKTDVAETLDYVKAKGGDVPDVATMTDEQIFEFYNNNKSNPIATPDQIKSYRQESAQTNQIIEANKAKVADEVAGYSEQLAEAKTQLDITKKAMTAGKSDLTLKDLAKIAGQYERDITRLTGKITKAGGTPTEAPTFVPGNKPVMEDVAGLPSRDVNADVVQEAPVVPVVAPITKPAVEAPVVAEPTPIIPPKNVEILNDPSTITPTKSLRAIEEEINTASIEGDNAKLAALIKEKEAIPVDEGQLHNYVLEAKSRDELEDVLVQNKDQVYDSLYKIKQEQGDAKVNELLNAMKQEADTKLGQSLYGTTAIDDMKEMVLGIPKDTEIASYNKKLEKINDFDNIVEDPNDYTTSPEYLAERAKVDARAQKVADDLLKPFFGKNYNTEVGMKVLQYMERTYGVTNHISETFTSDNQIYLGNTWGSKLEITSDGLHEALHLYKNLMSTESERLDFAALVHNQYKTDPGYKAYVKMRQEYDLRLSNAAAAEEFAAQKFTEFALNKQGYSGFEMNWETGRIKKGPDFKTPAQNGKSQVDLPFIGGALKQADIIWTRIKSLWDNQSKIELEYKKLMAGKASGKTDVTSVGLANSKMDINSKGEFVGWSGWNKNMEFKYRWEGDELVPINGTYNITGMDRNQAIKELDKQLALQQKVSQTTLNKNKIDTTVNTLIDDLKGRGWVDDTYVEGRVDFIATQGKTDPFIKQYLEADVRPNGSYRIIGQGDNVTRMKQVAQNLRNASSRLEQETSVQEALANGWNVDDIGKVLDSKPGGYWKNDVLYNATAPTAELPDWYNKMMGVEPKTDGNPNAKVPTAEELKAGDTYSFDSATKMGKWIKKNMGLDSDVAINIREHWEDSRIRLKKLQQYTGDGTTTDDMNAYQRIENAASKVEARKGLNHIMEKNIVDDMFVEAKAAGIDYKVLKEEVNDYTIAKTGLERIAKNEGRDVVFGRENPQETIDSFNKAIATIEASPHADVVKKFANDYQNISRQVLEVAYDGGSPFGIISKQEYDAMGASYPNHVRLARDLTANAEGDPLSNVFTQEDYSSSGGNGISTKTSGFKKIKGGDFAIDDILANQVQALDMMVAKVENNRAAQAVVNFANYYNSLPEATVGTGRGLFEVQNGRPAVGEARNVITAMYEGKPVSVRVNDSALYEAISGMNVEQMSGMYKLSQKLNGFRGAMATRFKLSFAVRNKFRDVQEMVNYIGSMTELKGQSTKALKQTFTTDMKTVRDFHHGVENEQTKLYQQMIDDGGAIGGLGLSTKSGIKENIAQLEKLNTSNFAKGKETVKNFFDNWNDVAENSSRFTVYKAALDGGLSRERAAWLSKEAGINFQRTGTAKGLRSMYMFFNPAVQGQMRTFRAWVNNPKEFAKFTLALGGATIGANQWNDSIDENWRDDTRLSAYTRNTNMIFLTPWENKDGEHYVVKIPLGFSYVPLKSVIDNGFDVVKGKTTMDKAAMEAFKAMTIGYNPISNDTSLGGVLPTQVGVLPIRFMGELLGNQDFMGSPITPKGKENLPASWQYYESTGDTASGKAAISTSRFLSDVTGGKSGGSGLIEISPEWLTYGMEQIFSGVGRDATRTIDTGVNIATGQPLKMSGIPFVESFVNELRPSRAGETEMYDILGRRDPQTVKETIAKNRIKERYDKVQDIPKSEIVNLRNLGMTSTQITNFLKEFNLSRTSKSFDQLSSQDASRIWGDLSPETQQELIDNGVAR